MGLLFFLKEVFFFRSLVLEAFHRYTDASTSAFEWRIARSELFVLTSPVRFHTLYTCAADLWLLSIWIPPPWCTTYMVRIWFPAILLLSADYENKVADVGLELFRQKKSLESKENELKYGMHSCSCRGSTHARTLFLSWSFYRRLSFSWCHPLLILFLDLYLCSEWRNETSTFLHWRCFKKDWGSIPSSMETAECDCNTPNRLSFFSPGKKLHHLIRKRFHYIYSQNLSVIVFFARPRLLTCWRTRS